MRLPGELFLKTAFAAHSSADLSKPLEMDGQLLQNSKVVPLISFSVMRKPSISFHDIPTSTPIPSKPCKGLGHKE